MTDDIATPTPLTAPGPRRLGRHRRFPALVGAVVVPAALLVAGCGDDAADTASDGASTSASATPSASTSPSASSTPSESASTSAVPSAEPTIDAVISKAVKPALKKGYPALVSTAVPDGWVVDSARYVAADGGSWTMSFTDGNGAPVVLHQAGATVEELLAENLSGEAVTAGSVDLKSAGLGTWAAWTGGDQTAITRELPSTSVIVVGADQDTVTQLAQTLVAAEDSDMPEAG